MRPGLHRNADGQLLVEIRAEFARVLRPSCTKSSWPPAVTRRTRFAVQADLDLVRIFHAAHQIERIAPQADLNDVFAVERKVVLHQNSAAGAERQTFDVLVLRKVGPDAVGRGGGRDVTDCRRPGG